MNDSLEIPSHAITLGDDMMVALEAARKAGVVLRDNYGKLVEVEEKAVGDLVSRIDREADEAVQEVIRGRRPEDAVLSEELSSDVVEDGGRLWVIDPLDATAAFLFGAGRSFVSVMISLRQNFETELAVILFPLTGEWFYAKRGEGAFKNGQKIDTKKVTKKLNEAWVEMNHYGDAAFETEEFAKLDKRLRSADGARLVTRFAPYSGVVARIVEQDKRIAAVVHDNNPQSVKQAPWDIIPAQLLLEEAGGVFVNLKGERVDPLKAELMVAAGNREVAEAILDLSL